MSEIRKLSPRLREVRDLLMAGRTRAEVAAALVVSPKTVESHVHRLRRAYGVASAREVVAAAWAERCAALEARCAEQQRLLGLAQAAAECLAGARDAA